MVSRIAHICIAARDLEEAEKFYCVALGLEKRFSFVRDGRPVGFYVAAGGGTFLEVFEAESLQESEKPLLNHVSLEVDDIDGCIAALRRHGHSVNDKSLGRDNAWQAWVTDPSGVHIELQQYTAQSSQLTGQDVTLPS